MDGLYLGITLGILNIKDTHQRRLRSIKMTKKMSGIRFSDDERAWLEKKAADDSVSITSIVRRAIRVLMNEDGK